MSELLLLKFVTAKQIAGKGFNKNVKILLGHKFK